MKTKNKVTGARAKALLARHGTTKPQATRAWKGDFALPDALERFYREVGPVNVEIPGYGNPYFLPRLSQLWSLQAGYRWNGITGKRLRSWDDDWLVVASEAGDPFILSRTTERVLYAIHGTGSWEPEDAFPDLNTMAACLALLGSIIVRAGASLTDEDATIMPKHRAAALKGVCGLVTSRKSAAEILTGLGWGP